MVTTKDRRSTSLECKAVPRAWAHWKKKKAEVQLHRAQGSGLGHKRGLPTGKRLTLWACVVAKPAVWDWQQLEEGQQDTKLEVTLGMDGDSEIRPHGVHGLCISFYLQNASIPALPV